MVAFAIALAFKAVYWGLLLSIAAILVACFVRSMIEDRYHHRRSLLRRLKA
jgi:hypothetical protein